MAKRISINQRHQDSMTISINRFRCREVILMKNLHKSELSHSWKTRQIQPVVIGPILDIFSIFLDGFEGSSAQSGQFENDEIAIMIFTFIDIWFLTNSYLTDNILQNSSFKERMQSQIIIAKVSKFISIIWMLGNGYIFHQHGRSVYSSTACVQLWMFSRF